MAIEVTLYDTDTLLGVMSQTAPVSNYWLDLCFPRQVNFTDEYIDFEKLVKSRKLAPLVVPTAQGKPSYSEASTVTRLKPAYVKPKDPVNPNRMIQRRPGELLPSSANRGPASRYNAVVGDIQREHREAIERRWEWLAAQAIIHGKVTLTDDAYPERIVDFGRDPGNTVLLSGDLRWGQADGDIIGNIESWRTKMRRLPFGGAVDRLTVGSDAWEVMRKDPGLLKQLETDVRGTDGNFRTGIREGLEVEYMGRISGTLDVYVYSDYYHDKDGTSKDFMSPKDVVLTGPGVSGVRAFGAILDNTANFQALPIYPKMWSENDPPVVYCMAQSAPLMVPVNPNCTLKATVMS